MFQEGFHAGEFLVSEGNGRISRATITIANGQGKLQAGTVLGQLAADSTYVVFDPAGNGGAETPKAILYAGVDATSAAKAATAITRLAEVNAAALAWKDGLTDAEKAAAAAALEATHIIVRS